MKVIATLVVGALVASLVCDVGNARDAGVELQVQPPTGPALNIEKQQQPQIQTQNQRPDSKAPQQDINAIKAANNESHKSVLSRVTSILVSPLAFGSPIGGIGKSNANKPLSRQQNEPIPDDDDTRHRMLRGAISKATELINEYKHHGLSNLPDLPHVLGLDQLMRVPDKIVRIELTMLQDLIQMSMEMLDNPVAGVLNFPGDMATMMSHVAIQLEQ